jgi:lysozyme family protein
MMRTPLFQAAVEHLLTLEGGLVDHPSDPGGLTNMGISLRAFPSLGEAGIRSLTRETAIELYHEHYWTRVPTGLPDGLTWMVFDASVNHGVARTRAWLEDYPTLEAFTSHRLRFYTRLSTWSTFGTGWTRRVASVLQEIAAWAQAEGASANPQRIGTFDTIVLHGFDTDAAVHIARGHLLTEPAVLRGRFVASRTHRGAGKLDVRMEVHQ